MRGYGELIASAGRVKVWKTRDSDTPYLVSLDHESGVEQTATLGCADGEGEVEGSELTADELSCVRLSADELLNERGAR